MATVECAAGTRRLEQLESNLGDQQGEEEEELTVEFEDVSITRQRTDVGRPVRVDDAEGEELCWNAAGPGPAHIRGVCLLLLLLFLGVAVPWLWTHLVVHGLLLA